MRILDNLGTVYDTFSPGVVILAKLINDLKTKFSRNKSESDSDIADEELLGPDDKTGKTDISQLSEEDLEEVDSGSEGNSLLGKLKKLIPKKKSIEASDEDTEEEGKVVKEDAEAAKKKRVSLMIRVFIGLLLVLFLLEEYIFPPENTVPEAPPIAAPSETNETNIQDAPEVEAPVDIAETSPETNESPSESYDNPEGQALPETNTETITDSESPSPDTDLATTPLPTEDTPEDLEPTLDTPTTTFTEDPAPFEDQPSETSGISEDIIGEDTPGTSEDDLTDKILLDLEKQVKTKKAEDVKKEYVAPPNYEYRGRGLVYNCQGKHWACVDGPSYKTCEDNASSLKYLKRPAECYPFNVYETVKGCEGTQYRMVSSSAKTKFCQEN